jgi:hypothetical protein
MPLYTNQSLIGVNLGNSDGATALFGLGNTTMGQYDTEWVYVNASVALATGTAVVINSSGTASLLNGTLSTTSTGKQIAFAQGTFAASDYGWVARRGNGIYVLVSSVSTVSVILYNSDTSGTLTTTSATNTIAGISLITASSTAVSSAVPAFVSWPRLVTAPLIV